MAILWPRSGPRRAAGLFDAVQPPQADTFHMAGEILVALAGSQEKGRWRRPMEFREVPVEHPSKAARNMGRSMNIHIDTEENGGL